MPPRARMVFVTLGLVLLFMSAVPLYRELTRRNDIWWTPPSMLVPLVDARDRVQIYVLGRPLTAALDTGLVRITDGGSLRTLAEADLGLRLNNWDRVRAGRVPMLIVYGAGCGFTLCLLLLLLTGRLAYRPERDRVSA